MSTAGAFDTTPVATLDDLAGWMEKGCKPKAEWRIGTEHEKFGYRHADYLPLPYDGDGPTITKVFDGLQRFGWEPLLERGRPTGLKREQATIALEPGGQFELSGAPLEHLHQTCSEAHGHLAEVRAVSDALGAGFFGLGYAPHWSLEAMPRVPKERYAIMRAYMERVGRLGREMMFRTCTIQVNLDFESETDMARKLRVGLALQPVATALFANGPIAMGRPSGWKSLRAFIWTDTDPDRTGFIPAALNDGFSFEAYVDWALDVPMYFLRRDGRFLDVAGRSFRDFLEGKLPGFEGERPSLGDWEDHLSTLFPEARAKRFIEMRGADGGPWSRICALPAFWVGLLYHAPSLEAADRLTKGWTHEECEAMRLAAPRLGLSAPAPGGRTLQDVAKDVLAMADDGLKARGFENAAGEDERVFLSELHESAESGLSPADHVLAKWRGLDGNVEALIRAESF